MGAPVIGTVAVGVIANRLTKLHWISDFDPSWSLAGVSHALNSKAVKTPSGKQGLVLVIWYLVLCIPSYFECSGFGFEFSLILPLRFLFRIWGYSFLGLK